MRRFILIAVLAAAEPLFREALALRRKLLGDEHPGVANSLDGYAGMLKNKKDYAAAEPLFREAIAVRRKALGDDHPETAISINNLAVMLDTKGDPAAAEPLYREALAVRLKKLPSHHLDIAQTRTSLAWALTDMAADAASPRDARLERFAAAEGLLLAAQETLARTPSAPRGRVRATLQGLVRLYDAWHAAEPDQGYDQKANEWRARQASVVGAPKEPKP